MFPKKFMNILNRTGGVSRHKTAVTGGTLVKELLNRTALAHSECLLLLTKLT